MAAVQKTKKKARQALCTKVEVHHFFNHLDPRSILYRAGPHMVAINFMSGTKYACNQSNDWELICLLSQIQNGLFMLAMSKMLLESHDLDFWTNPAKTNFRLLQAYIWFVLDLRLQAY